jgi:hypothetical protein
MHRIAVLSVAALVWPAISAAQQPTGLARSALDDSSFTWIARQGPGLRVYFLEGSYAAAHQDSLIARVAAARAHDLAILGAARYDSTLHVFFVEQRPQMERLVGMRATGFAERATGSIFLMTNPDWRAFERHEIMHVLAAQRWGLPAEPSAWIQEGFAQFADGACGGYPIDPVVVGLAADRGYVPLDTLTTRFRQLNDLTAYLQAASFVGYVYRAYGRDAVRAIWQRGLGPAAKALGRTPEELYDHWKHTLPQEGTHPTTAELAAIRSKGCG